ncbi:MAG: cation-translocating P-type ATPase [Myxococcota bacterium]
MSERSIDGLRGLGPLSERRALTAQVVEAPLDEAEQAAISRRLGANMLGAGLLGLGVGLAWLVPAQALVAELIQAIAALIVSVPVVCKAAAGLFATPPRHFTDQLVTLALLAAMASGDFVSATLVPLFLEIGHLFEERSALGAQAAIEGLRALCARRATLWTGQQERELAPDELDPGDVIIVRPGEMLPVDGVVRTGHASIDQAPVTGESRYEDVAPGDRVFAGTLNLDGMLHVEVRDTGGATVLGRVVQVLQEVEHAKTPVVRMLERVAGAYLPVVLVIACGSLLWTGQFDRFITVLIVACPCALVLAAPSAMVAAMSTATRFSILVKNAAFIEQVAAVDTLILDKTGTVTEGAQSVDQLLPTDGIHEDQMLAWGAAAARGSRHPVSRAILDAARAKGLTIPEAEEIREIPGRGVYATVRDQGQGQTIRVGRASWLAEFGIDVPKRRTSGGAWIARDQQVLGFVSLFDHARDEAKGAIEAMRGLGFDRIVLLTGDRRDVAERIGEQLGMDEVVAEVLPSGKLEIVRREQEAGHRVLMVGDGVNDALALCGAEVGVAIGARVNEVALGGADVALLTDDLGRLPLLVDLADRTRRIILGNVVIGLGFSVGMLALATAGWINPLMGALLHNGGAIFVVLNSSRLLRDVDEGGSR